MGGCSKAPPVDPVEQAWTDFGVAYGELEGAEEKSALIEQFVRDHPDTTYAGRLAGAVAYYRGEEMGDPAGAYALLGETLAKNTDPEARYEIGMAMFPLAVELGEPMDLGAVADELASNRPLSFTEKIDVADLAIEHRRWEVGAEYAEAALADATPEAFLSDYPDDGFTQEEAAAKADRRRVMGLADLGWALWNLGREDEAISAFEQAMPLRTVDYVGASDTPLDLYCGKAAMAGGDPKRAMELLAPGAIMGSDDDATATLREAYAAVNGSDEGFDEYVWSERQRLARTVDDFTLTDYAGASHEFSTLSEGNVTLLAFWFPT
jgi:tetratricopeptide (TPR) repeat protein